MPGVKEMFERAAKKRARDEGGVGGEEEEGKRDINRRNLDARYFGFGRDEEDEKLLRYERKKEKEAVERVGKMVEDNEDEEWEPLPGDGGDGVSWKLPTMEEVQEELVERRRRQLLDNLG